jgi:hypothetical protein
MIAAKRSMLMMSLLPMKRIWKLNPTARRRMFCANRVQYSAAILMLNSRAVTMGPVLKGQRFLMMHLFLAFQAETLLREGLLLLIQELAAAVLIVVYRQCRMKWMG